MEKRLTLQCWNCPKRYFLTLEITGQQKIIVTCPYCNTDAVLNLRPYLKKIKAVMRGEEKDMQSEAFQLPDILSTSKPD